MPWSNGKRPKATLRNHLNRLAAVNKKARDLHEAKISRIAMYDKAFLHSLVAYRIIDSFAAKNDLPQLTVVLILIMKQYKQFVANDAYLWGLVDSQPRLATLFKSAMLTGAITHDGKQRYRYYYLTIKGERMVEEFDIYYKKRLKEILKSNKNGNKDLIYAVASPASRGKYKSGYLVESK